jgi:methylthioribose-1-phosphate isomerase
MTTIRVIYPNGARRTYSNWIELYRAFDVTPIRQVQGAVITEQADNQPAAKRYRVSMPTNYDGTISVLAGYPLEVL